MKLYGKSEIMQNDGFCFPGGGSPHVPARPRTAPRTAPRTSPHVPARVPAWGPHHRRAEAKFGAVGCKIDKMLSKIWKNNNHIENSWKFKKMQENCWFRIKCNEF